MRIEIVNKNMKAKNMEVNMPINNYIIRKRGIAIVKEKIQNRLLVEKRRLLAEDKEKKSKSKPKRKLTKKQQEFVNDLKQALEEVKLHQQGKIKLQTWQELLKELKEEKG